MLHNIMLGIAFIAVFILGLFIGRANPKKVQTLGDAAKSTAKKASDAIKDKLNG